MGGLTLPIPTAELRERLGELTNNNKGLVRAVFWLDVAWACQVFGASVTSGPRSDQHNADVGGQPDSEHTQSGGWGCAADLWFDLEHHRDLARESFASLGWHTYVGPDYHSKRLHVQAFAYGVKPPGLGPPAGSVAGTR